MKTAILHLSDLHIASDTDYIIQNINVLVSAIRYYTNECNHCIIVVTGDIIDKGNIESFPIAKTFFTELKKQLLQEKEIEIDFIIVPGNHDLDFSTPQKLRNMAISTLNKIDSLSDDNEELVEIALSPQKHFWKFYEDLCNNNTGNKISYKKTFQLENGGNLIFHCYNTALLSTREEQPGSLVIHEECFIKEDIKKPNDITICISHHSCNWLSTKTNKNNQKLFLKHLLKEANIILCGHEHITHAITVSSDFKASGIHYLEAGSFKYGEEKKFDLIIINDENTLPKINKLSFHLKEETCHLLEEKSLPIIPDKVGLTFNETHLDYLSKLSLPIKHPRLEKLTLQDVYVYPDIMPLSKDNKSLYNYEDSSNLIERLVSDKVYIFDGANQAGKTAFLKQLSINAYNFEIYPLWLNGAEIKHPNINSLLKKAFKNQYEDSKRFDDYTSLPKEKRILFIDNIDKTSLNQESLDKMMESILNNYQYIVATTKPNTNLLTFIRQSSRNKRYCYYHILSFGHVKRNELIEKWFRLGTDRYQIEDAELIDKVKLVYNQISSILSGDLLPAYPAFLLTMLHGMNSMIKSYNLTPTTYANLYHTLIITSLGRANVPQDKLNGVLTFLTELAYEMYINREREIGLLPNHSKVNLETFYIIYAKTRIPPYSVAALTSILIQAEILSPIENGNLCFSYKYIYYYLVGNKIAALVDTGKGSSELTYLCNNINSEESANILVFLAYLVKNPTSLLDEVRLTTQIPLNEITPITLSLNDPLFNRLSSLVTTIKEHVLLTDINHKEARNQLLKAKDKAEIEEQIKNEDNENSEQIENFDHLDGTLKDINIILKSVRVIGQIIKNQNGTLTIPELESLVEDSYLSSFRFIGLFSELVENDFQTIVDEICLMHRIDNRNRSQVEDLVSKVLNGILFKLCLTVFSNLALSVGTTDLQLIFDNVAEKIGSPAASIVSFTINSYYGPFRIEYLKEMVKKYSGNPVMMNLIQARVRHYVYHHELSYNQKQQFGQIAGLKLINSKK